MTMIRHGTSGMAGRPSTESNNPSSSPPPTRLVQSNSVQSQFLALTRDRDNFRKAQEAAEREYRVVEQRQQELRTTERQLVQDIRKAKEELGGVHRQHTMLKEERTRLQRQLDEEQKDLRQCTEQVDASMKKEKKNCVDFCKDMESLSERMETMLQKLEDARLQQLVSMETIEYLRDIRHKNKTQPPEGFHKAFEEAVANLKESTFKWNREMEVLKQMKAEVNELRAMVLRDNPEVSEEQLMALERAWENPSLMTSEIQELSNRMIHKRYPHGALPMMHPGAGPDGLSHLGMFYDDQLAVDSESTAAEDCHGGLTSFQGSVGNPQDKEQRVMLRDMALHGNQFQYYNIMDGTFDSSNGMEDDTGTMQDVEDDDWAATETEWSAQEESQAEHHPKRESAKAGGFVAMAVGGSNQLEQE